MPHALLGNMVNNELTTKVHLCFRYGAAYGAVLATFRLKGPLGGSFSLVLNGLLVGMYLAHFGHRDFDQEPGNVPCFMLCHLLSSDLKVL